MRALVVIFGASDGTEMLRVVRLLASSEAWTPDVCLAGSDADLGRLDLSSLAGVPTCDAAGADRGLPDGAAPASGRAGLRARVEALPWLLRAPLSPLRRLVNRWLDRRHYRREAVYPDNRPTWEARLASARQLIARRRPSLVVLGLESVGHASALVARAASDAGVPVVVVPYSAPVNRAELLQMVGERPDHQAPADADPRWVTEWRGRRVLRLPAGVAAVHDALGLTPPAPWVAGGAAWTDRVAIESEDSRDFHRREGFDPERLTVVGALVHDELAAARERASETRAALGVPDGPLVVVGLPPDFTATRPQAGFADYAAFVDYWAGALGALEAPVVVRPHPSVDPACLGALRAAGVTVTTRDTATLVPLAALYVSGVSATIRWAIALRIPVLAFDAYRFDYADYDDAGGVQRVTERDAFERALRLLSSDADARARLAAAYGDDDRWGRVDGRAGARLLALFDELTRAASPPGACPEPA